MWRGNRRTTRKYTGEIQELLRSGIRQLHQKVEISAPPSLKTPRDGRTVILGLGQLVLASFGTDEDIQRVPEFLRLVEAVELEWAWVLLQVNPTSLVVFVEKVVDSASKNPHIVAVASSWTVPVMTPALRNDLRMTVCYAYFHHLLLSAVYNSPKQDTSLMEQLACFFRKNIDKYDLVLKLQGPLELMKFWTMMGEGVNQMVAAKSISLSEQYFSNKASASGAAVSVQIFAAVCSDIASGCVSNAEVGRMLMNAPPAEYQEWKSTGVDWIDTSCTWNDLYLSWNLAFCSTQPEDLMSCAHVVHLLASELLGNECGLFLWSRGFALFLHVYCLCMLRFKGLCLPSRKWLPCDVTAKWGETNLRSAERFGTIESNRKWTQTFLDGCVDLFKVMAAPQG